MLRRSLIDFHPICVLDEYFYMFIIVGTYTKFSTAVLNLVGSMDGMTLDGPYYSCTAVPGTRVVGHT